MDRSRARPGARTCAVLTCLFTGLVALGACGDDESEADVSSPEAAGNSIAEAQCGKIEECCGVAESPYGDYGSCVEQLGSAYERAIEAGGGEGWDYDPRCAKAYLDLFDQVDCTGQNLATLTFCSVDWCYAGNFHHGRAQVGQACADPRDCDINLQCANGTCSRVCGQLEGEPCGVDSEGVSSSFCATHLQCNPQTNQCVALPTVGQTCPTGACVAGAVCTDGACVAPAADGTECINDLACLSTYCDYLTPTPEGRGQCAPLPGAGEPCTSRCTLDAQCDGTTCQALPGLGEPCPNGVCGGGHFCEEGACRPPPSLWCPQ